MAFVNVPIEQPQCIWLKSLSKRQFSDLIIDGYLAINDDLAVSFPYS